MKNLSTQKTNKELISQTKSGFTLIETLVAISILLVSIAGPLTIASKGLSAAVYAKDQITAIYLTQEAVEFIKNKRDQNTLNSSNWLAGFGIPGITPNCTTSRGCIVDIKNNTINECPASGCLPLRYSQTSGLYSYNASDPATFYTRTVRVSSVNSDEVTVEVGIGWTTGVFNRSFVVRSNIYNWQQ